MMDGIYALRLCRRGLTVGGFEHFLNSTRTAGAVHLDVELVSVFRHLCLSCS